ncbi:MAG: type II CRISPR RNA-guided endonuclease Cas9, partial [Spirochaetota bacterium]
MQEQQRKKLLALDLGIASIGWAISGLELRTERDIADFGVRIFRTGMESGKSGYNSRAAERRQKRGPRRLYERRLRRKLALLRILIHQEMCPLSSEQFNEWETSTRGKGKTAGTSFPQHAAFIQWLRLCPYELRSRATHEKLDPIELGRALYHMAQRRGFKSNRKDSSDKQGKDEEIAKQDSEKLKELGCKTLGEYLYKQKQQGELLRFRHRGDDTTVKSSRLNYEGEFELIAEVQGIKQELKEKLAKALFSQRPLKSQKHLVGKCVLEAHRTRCPISAIEAEEFGLYQVLNNIKVVPSQGDEAKRTLTTEEKQLLTPLFLRKSNTFPAKDLRDKLRKHLKDKELRINYRNDQPLGTYPTLRLFYSIWGENWKAELHRAYSEHTGKTKTEEQAIQDVWHVLYNFGDEKKLQAWGQANLGLQEEPLKTFVEMNLKEGYSKLSRYALLKIVPFLKRGLGYHEAVQIANLDEVFLQAGKAELWEAESRQIIEKLLRRRKQIEVEREEIIERNRKIEKEREEQYRGGDASSAEVAARHSFVKLTGISEGLKNYLTAEYKIEETYSPRLYHHSAIETFPAVPAA